MSVGTGAVGVRAISADRSTAPPAAPVTMRSTAQTRFAISSRPNSTRSIALPCNVPVGLGSIGTTRRTLSGSGAGAASSATDQAR